MITIRDTDIFMWIMGLLFMSPGIILVVIANDIYEMIMGLPYVTGGVLMLLINATGIKKLREE